MTTIYVKRFLVVFACASVFIGLGVSDSSARGGGHSGGSTGGSSTGSHPVHGYTRKDGTYVPAYNRRGPGEGGHSRSGSSYLERRGLSEGRSSRSGPINLERGAASAHYTASTPGQEMATDGWCGMRRQRVSSCGTLATHTAGLVTWWTTSSHSSEAAATAQPICSGKQWLRRRPRIGGNNADHSAGRPPPEGANVAYAHPRSCGLSARSIPRGIL
jgi:hypothetical protein